MECAEGISAPATSGAPPNSSTSESSSSDGTNIGKLKREKYDKILYLDNNVAFLSSFYRPRT